MTLSRTTRSRRRGFAPARIALVTVAGLVLALGAAYVESTPAGANAPVTVRAFGTASSFGATPSSLNAPIVAITNTHDGKGYWLLGQDGGIFSYGNAAFYGSTGGIRLNQPVVGMAATATGHGYWIVASDGGVFSFGDASFHGSTGRLHLNQPIVGMAATPSGKGYWLVAADGGIFSFGDATFHGSTGSAAVGATIVGIARSKSGHGYWLASSTGRVFAFGDAHPMASVVPATPIVGVEVSPGGTGLWLVSQNGSVYTTGTAPFLGNATGSLVQAVGIAGHATGYGYWIATRPSGPPLPANSGSGRRIVYSNAQQRVWLVEANGQISHTYLVSGRHGLPAAGTYQVFSKVPSSISGDLILPWTLKFAWAPSGNPIDFHGIPLTQSGSPIEPDSLLGTPQSHGCVRMKQSEAQFVWNWASVGTTVVVTDIGW